MLLNFALECVGTNVSCNKISTDGYECTNLISPNLSCRKKGFLSEHFIKPPVDITFTFPCNVTIYCILVSPFVGQQSSSQLEIYCASRPIPKTKHGQKRAEDKKHTISHPEQPPMSYQVSKMTTPYHCRVGFHNYCFPSHLLGQYSNMINSIKLEAMAEMRHSKSELFNAATSLTIRISRIKNGSTPALSDVEIWGCVSSQINSQLRESIHDKYNASLIHPKLCISSSENESRSVRKNKTKEMRNQAVPEVHIPEEFIDPLTCEIMAIPMLLPSGKNVDKSTLDRYFDSEASHGRQPRDPFTGVEFHGNAKPLPNGALKARIDKYLSENSHDPSVALLPRTVSCGNQYGFQRKRKNETFSQVSSLIKKGRDVGLIHNSDHINTMDSHLDKNITQGTDDQAGPSSSSHDSLSSTFFNEKNEFFSEESYFSEPVDGKIKTAGKSRTHEACLKDSLNNALSTLLGSSSSNVKKDSTKEPSFEPTVLSCSKCKVHLLEDVVIYTFPCSHFLCRTCLLSYNSTESGIQCFTCHKQFLRSDVVRAHSFT